LLFVARATRTRCANFPHHGSRRCTSSGLVADDMIALLILPIAEVKFSAVARVKFAAVQTPADPPR
jgi:hypothetical protein